MTDIEIHSFLQDVILPWWFTDILTIPKASLWLLIKNSLCNILIFSLYTAIVVTWLMITLHCLVLSIPERTLLSRQSKVWSQRHLFQWKLLEFFCSIYVYIYVCFILCMQWYHDHIVVFRNLTYYFFECNIIPIDGANDHVYKMNHNIW